MARNKTREKKEFLIAQRSKVGPGYLNTPVWIIQKAGRRIWNRRQRRNWRETGLGKTFNSLLLDNKKAKKINTNKSGKKVKTAKYKINNRKRNTTAK